MLKTLTGWQDAIRCNTLLEGIGAYGLLRNWTAPRSGDTCNQVRQTRTVIPSHRGAILIRELEVWRTGIRLKGESRGNVDTVAEQTQVTLVQKWFWSTADFYNTSNDSTIACVILANTETIKNLIQTPLHFQDPLLFCAKLCQFQSNQVSLMHHDLYDAKLSKAFETVIQLVNKKHSRLKQQWTVPSASIPSGYLPNAQSSAKCSSGKTRRWQLIPAWTLSQSTTGSIQKLHSTEIPSIALLS